MKAEVIAVGTELLLGDLVDSNSAWISQRLATRGVDVLFHTSVGDNLERIAGALESAARRSDVVIVTGGLGPTHDDLTREAIELAFDRPLARDPELEEWLRQRFASFGRQMPVANLRQALVPAGAEPLPNPRGTAPGTKLVHGSTRIYAVPGVPSEMQGMIRDHVLPDLGASGELVSRVLKVAGMGESDLAARIEDVIADLDASRGATIALLASAGEVKIRISAKAPSRDQALERIEPVEIRLRSILGEAVYGADADSLEGVVAASLTAGGLSLAVAESVTGGMVASRLVEVPGANDFLVAAIVAYQPSSKIRLLGISPSLLDDDGPVSDRVALAMARGAREAAVADVGLATTGEAGPAPRHAPAGTVHLGLAWEGGELSRSFVAPGERETVRRWAAASAINLLRLWLAGRG